MGLTANEKKEIETELAQLVQLYRRVKLYLFASEKVSGGNRISAPAINELRNAFEHHMRVAAVMYAEYVSFRSMFVVCNAADLNLHMFRQMAESGCM